MKVHEAWSPENSHVIFQGSAAVRAVSQAIDRVYEDKFTLGETEADVLADLAARVDYQVASGEPKELYVKRDSELDLIYQGLVLQIRQKNKENPTLGDHYYAWRASRLVGKIARATV
jgi:hypothetical protein